RGLLSAQTRLDAQAGDFAYALHLWHGDLARPIAATRQDALQLPAVRLVLGDAGPNRADSFDQRLGQRALEFAVPLAFELPLQVGDRPVGDLGEDRQQIRQRRLVRRGLDFGTGIGHGAANLAANRVVVLVERDVVVLAG